MISKKGLINGHKNSVIEFARDLAGVFYEQASQDEYMGKERSARFRQTYPTLKHYLRGLQVCPNGDVKIDKPGWRYHEKQAYKKLCEMLGLPQVNEQLKQAIFKDVIEYHEASLASDFKSTQRQTEALH